MNKKINILFVLFILVIISLVSVQAFSYQTASPDGIPFCCPVDVNEPAIREYHQIKADEYYSGDEDKTCKFDGKSMPCPQARELYISEKTEIDRIKIEEQVKSCRDKYKSQVEYYQDSVNSMCNPNSGGYRDWFVPLRATQDEVRALKISSYDLSYEQKEKERIESYNFWTDKSFHWSWTPRQTGSMKEQETSIEKFYFSDKTQSEFVNNIENIYADIPDLSSLGEGLANARKAYYNSVISKNKEAYTSCWSGSSFRSCRASCDIGHEDDWKLVSYEDTYSDMYNREEYDKRSKIHNDCISSCSNGESGEYYLGTEMHACMYNKFYKDVCWKTSYFSSYGSVLGSCDQYYGVIKSNDNSEDAKFYKLAADNGFYVYGSGEENVGIKGYGVKFGCSKGMELNPETGNCDPIVEVTKDKVVIKLSKSSFDPNKDKEIPFTVTVTGTNRAGEKDAYAHESVPGIGVKVEDNASGTYNFVISGDPMTDSNGVARMKVVSENIKFSSISQDSIKVYIYELDNEDNKDFFTIGRPQIKILNITQTSSSPIWQGSWGTFEVTVDGIANEDKFYQLGSVRNSDFMINGVEFPHRAMESSSSNTFSFSWRAPKITKERRMNDIITSRIGEALEGAALKAVEDKLKTEALGKLTKIKDLNALIDKYGLENIYQKKGLPIDPEQLEAWYKVAKYADSGLIQSQMLIKGWNNTQGEGEDIDFTRAKNVLAALQWLEGPVGGAVLNNGPGAVLSYGLMGVKAWYNIVDDTIEAANSKVIEKEFPIVVVVRDKQGKVDTDKIQATVAGEELLIID